jgi:hypothetical protein
MKVTFKRLVGPEYMIPAMRVTRGKDMHKDKLPSLETWYRMILSEHSSHRAVKYRVYIEDIPFFAHVHLRTHHTGIEFHVYSSRDDDGTQEVTARDDLKQGDKISLFFDANVQAIINIARKRLCYKSHKVTQDILRNLRKSLMFEGDAYDRILGLLLMPTCKWYGGVCAEPDPCGKMGKVKKLSDIHKHIFSEK